MPPAGKKRFGVWGNGGDVSMTRLLLGLGLKSFSMHPAQILTIKQEVLRSDTRKLAPWAQQMIDGEDAAPPQAA